MKLSHNRILYVLFCFIIIISISIYLSKDKNNIMLNKIETFVENELIKNRQMDNQIDLLTYSTFSHQCCPGTYTSSSGCLCNNNNEKSAIYTRGGNRYL